jgi:hypothetical protein
MNDFKIIFEPIIQLKGENLGIETYKTLSIILNSQQAYNDREYLWYFFYALVPEVQKYDELPHKVDFFNGPIRLFFRRSCEKVDLKLGPFGNSMSKTTNPPRKILGETTIPYLKFLLEVEQVTEQFLDQILQINPEVQRNPEVVKFIEERAELMKLIAKLKSESK